VSDHRSHEGPHRGGAGKGGWGKPGDELNAPKEGDDAEPEPEPEEPDNEISIEDFEAAKAAKKAALNAAMAKGATAKEVDSSAFASMTLAAKSEDVNEFSLDGAGPKAKRERERKAKEAAKLELGFKSAPTAPAEDRPARGAGGRGGRGDGRGGGRGGRGAAGGRGGRGGDRPAGGRGGSGLNVKIEDASAFPTLGK
jgi:plasminogen activator inhibitor 1 RNA-binding protein